MNEYRVLAYIYLHAENYADARYKFEAALPDEWAATIHKIESNERAEFWKSPSSKESQS